MNFTGFNTSTLAYSLLSGRLESNRKHSEQLNKYLAGYIDTDGCISLFFYKTRTIGRQRVTVTLSISQAAVNDPDFTVLRALRNFYKLGSLYYSIPTDERESSICTWTLRDADAKQLFNRLGKHMRLKATHFDNMVWISDEHRDIEDIPECIVAELKEYRDCSRENTTYFKMPKHLSWAYVAGVIAGDGCVKLYEKEGKYPTMIIKVTQQDQKLLSLFKRDFRGGIYANREWFDWERNVGINNASFAIPFLKNVRKYIMHPEKYKKIDRILHIHEDHRQQRLNREAR